MQYQMFCESLGLAAQGSICTKIKPITGICINPDKDKLLPREKASDLFKLPSRNWVSSSRDGNILRIACQFLLLLGWTFRSKNHY